MLTQLIHRGVIVPDPPPPRGLVLTVCGEPLALAPKAEEMALAWARKQGTPYVEDRAFVRNFLADFAQALGKEARLSETDVDWSAALRIVEAERQAKDRLTADERKALAAERKMQRAALREEYGYAVVDGERVALGNYIAEPGGIFMGRGQHPLRGRWKEGARHEDICLNLSPDAPRPAGGWGEIVWQPDSLWVTRWQDQLSGRMKYVWLGDTAGIKQQREARKFDKAHDLHAQLEAVRAQIERDLAEGDARRRMLATACTLIDALCLRVGDEKDPDEADTVGATTLRPEHVKLHPSGRAEFKFLGKDSVLWHKTLDLPDAVRQNLEELIRTARPSSASSNGDRSHPTRDLPQVFPDISSRNVNVYLSGILPGLTAKVFRTHHATIAVRESLEQSGVEAGDADYKKWEAASVANLEAAVLCNHIRQAPATWPQSKQRFRERQEKADARLQACREQVKACREVLSAMRLEAREKRESASPDKRKQVKARYEVRIEAAERRLAKAEAQLAAARPAVGKIKAEASIAAKKRTWNLGTSLKSYIDPRVFHRWGQQVEYDALERYYPNALRQKFAWVRDEE